MARSRWKLLTFSRALWKSIKFYKQNRKMKSRKKVYYHDRGSNIPQCFTFRYMRVHKGRLSRRLYVTKYIIGMKFGEFGFTRKPYHFPLKKMKKRKNIFLRK